MFLTKEQLQELDKETIIEYTLKISNFNQTLSDMDERIKELESYNSVTSNSNTLLTTHVDKLEKKIIALEKGVISNNQYARNRQLELHRVPTTIPEKNLKKVVCSMLSLTGQNVQVCDLDKCHRLKNEESVIIEFKFRDKRDPVLMNRKFFKNNKKELTELGMDKAILTESLCKEYQELDYICRSLKRNKVIAETWFFNGRLYIKHATEDERRVQITHISDLYKEVAEYEIKNIMLASVRPFASANLL